MFVVLKLITSIWLSAAQYSFSSRSSAEQEIRFLGMVHYWFIDYWKCSILVWDSSSYKYSFL